MKALRFDGSVTLEDGIPVPHLEGEALVRVEVAGICNTDLEIIKGYAGFKGTLGHEFVGRVVESPDGRMLNKRVVGEINVGCQVCHLCLTGGARHCPKRTVLGIKNRDGVFAEYLSLPLSNLIEIPDAVSNEEAVMVEPLAAACRIFEQVELHAETTVCLIGDGKLSQLIARALAHTRCHLTVVGKHPDKLAQVERIASRRIHLSDASDSAIQVLRQTGGERFDVVIEASGAPTGLPLAIQIVKPVGTIVLKSTHHNPSSLDLSQVVVNEVRILGSRCGRFQPAIELLERRSIEVASLISETFQFDDALRALESAAKPSSLKVLIQVTKA